MRRAARHAKHTRDAKRGLGTGKTGKFAIWKVLVVTGGRVRPTILGLRLVLQVPLRRQHRLRHRRHRRHRRHHRQATTCVLTLDRSAQSVLHAATATSRQVHRATNASRRTASNQRATRETATATARHKDTERREIHRREMLWVIQRYRQTLTETPCVVWKTCSYYSYREVTTGMVASRIEGIWRLKIYHVVLCFF